jgi:hypothetical protein
METQPLPAMLSQMIRAKLGLFCSERLSIDIYFLNEVIDLLIPTFNIKTLQEEFDKDFGEGKWKYIMLKKKKLDVKLAYAKTFYDAISDKSLVRKNPLVKNMSTNSLEDNIQKTFKKFFNQASLGINLIQPDIYLLFVFLLNKSSIRTNTIPAEYFKNLEQSANRKISVNRGERDNPPLGRS